MTSAACQPRFQSYCCHGDLDLVLCWLGSPGIARSRHLATSFVHPSSLQPISWRKKSNLAWWSPSRLTKETPPPSTPPGLLAPSALSHFIFRVSTSPEKWITHHGKVSITFSDSKRIMGSFVCASLSELATPSTPCRIKKPGSFSAHLGSPDVGQLSFAFSSLENRK